MTYHKIPSNWSGRIDMFSYGEQHLRSFEVEKGNLISHISYELKEDSRKTSNLGTSLMTHCTGYWLDFPYYGIPGGVGSQQSIYVQQCWDICPPSFDGPDGGTTTNPSGPSGGGGSGAGSYGGIGPSTTYGIDDPLNFCNGPDCFPFPEEDCNSFEKRVNHVLNSEGGFVNDPIDKGGATNRGISWDVWVENAQNILGKQPTLANLENLSAEEAKTIYKVKYWDKIFLDDIEDGDLRWLIFDFYVNSGSNSIIVLQKVLNEMGHSLSVDGGLGPNTINAINETSSVIDLYNNFKEGRVIFIENIVQKDIDRYLKKHPVADENDLRKITQLKFKNGWMNRISNFIEKTIQNFKDVNC
jgi:lysozyme family protein